MKMQKGKKARRYSSPLVKELLSKITHTEMRQTREKMGLAARIEEIMENKGLKKGQFAKQLGKNPSEITKWLSGTHNFTIDTLTEIGQVLGVPISDFFGKKEMKIVYSIQYEVVSETNQPTIILSTPYNTHNRYIKNIKNTPSAYAEHLFSSLIDTYPNG